MIEEQFFDNKIFFNQLDNSWIIPVKLILFKNEILIFNTITDKIFIGEEFKKNCIDDYYFEIQTSNDTFSITSNIFSTNNRAIDIDDKDFCYFYEIRNFFIIIWEHDKSVKLNSFTLTNSNDLETILVEKSFFKRVRLLDKEAIIIPLMFKSFSNLKYVIKNKLYINNSLIFTKTNYDIAFQFE